MSWFPFLGFRELPSESVAELDLDPMWKWSAFVADWFGHGIVFFVKATAPTDAAINRAAADKRAAVFVDNLNRFAGKD